MFDAIEAINDIIDDINDDAMEYAESCYEEIYEELCYRVECGDLTAEEAEMVNQAAYEKYVSEAKKCKSEDESECCGEDCDKKPKKKKVAAAIGKAAGVAAGAAALGYAAKTAVDLNTLQKGAKNRKTLKEVALNKEMGKDVRDSDLLRGNKNLNNENFKKSTKAAQTIFKKIR